MDDLEQIRGKLQSGLNVLQQVQELYDQDMWDISEPIFDKVRHIHIHLSISIGKLAKLLERLDHRAHLGENVEAPSRSEVGPILADLVMHAAQIASAYQIDLGSALAYRYKENALRFAPDSHFARFGD